MNITDLHLKCQSIKLSYQEAELILHEWKREERFQLFIALYDATLKSDPTTVFRVFREAYCITDNIFYQICNSKFPFNLNEFLNNTRKAGVDLRSLMNDDEKRYYTELPRCFTIYRGVSEEEYNSKNYGISWSLSFEEAQDYVYFDKNKVVKGKGGVVSKDIEKRDIFTIFSVYGKCEIIYINASR